MKKIPKGFKLSHHMLVMTKEGVKRFEETVLRFLVRDFYLLYTKQNHFPDDPKSDFVKVCFYVQPEKELSIIYRMGILYNEAFYHLKSNYFVKHGGHTVAHPFPEKYHIDIVLPDYPQDFIETPENSENID